MNTALRNHAGEQANARTNLPPSPDLRRGHAGWRRWRALLRGWLALCMAVCVARADTEAPQFVGQMPMFNGVEYTWQYPATEEPDTMDPSIIWHMDTYLDGSGGNPVRVWGRVGNANLAVVDGNATGYVQNQAFVANGYVTHGTQEVDRQFNGHTYRWSGGGHYSHVDINLWQLIFDYGTETYTDYWTSGWPTFTTTVDASGNGTFSGAETGVVFGGNLYCNQTVAWSSYGLSSYNLFGASYTISGVTYSTYSSESGTQILAATENYIGGNGGSLNLFYRNILDYPDGYGGNFWGNDPVVGDFGGSHAYLGNLTWNFPRTAPSFAPSQLWVNSTLVTWQPSPILNADGDVADHYSGTDVDGNTVTLAVSGNVPAFHNPGSYNSNPTVGVEIRNSDGYLQASGTGNYMKAEPNYFNVWGWYIGAAQFSRGEPLWLPLAPSLWVNGSRYTFRGGIDDSAGNSVDTYAHDSVGMLILSGNPSNNAMAAVRVSYHGTNYTGLFNAMGNGLLEVSGLSVETSGLNIPAFWVYGSLYQRSATDESTYANAGGQSLSVSFANGIVQLSGADAISPFSGSFAVGNGGIFLCTRSTSGSLLSCPANADGSLQLFTTNPPVELPPAIAVTGEIWQFLGSTGDDVNPAEQVAYYGNAAGGGPGSLFLKITLGDGSVALVNCAAQTSATGTYSLVTHLFQTTPGQLPMPMYGTAPMDNNVRWGWLQPGAGRPSTVLVAGEVWGYTGSDADGDHYAGYYGGQQLSFAANIGRNGVANVTLADPIHPNTVTQGIVSTGTYYNGAFTMIGGSPAVFSADGTGAVVAPTGLSLSTTGADLDVVGNLFSLGSLANDPSTVGLTLSFSDNLTTARLASSLSRPLSEWLWCHAAAGSPATGVPMMKLDSGNRLSLFDPADVTNVGIFLNPDPAVGSRINGPLRIPPAGDLDMGAFTNGPKPDGGY